MIAGIPVPAPVPVAVADAPAPAAILSACNEADSAFASMMAATSEPARQAIIDKGHDRATQPNIAAIMDATHGKGPSTALDVLIMPLTDPMADPPTCAPIALAITHDSQTPSLPADEETSQADANSPSIAAPEQPPVLPIAALPPASQPSVQKAEAAGDARDAALVPAAAATPPAVDATPLAAMAASRDMPDGVAPMPMSSLPQPMTQADNAPIAPSVGLSSPTLPSPMLSGPSIPTSATDAASPHNSPLAPASPDFAAQLGLRIARRLTAGESELIVRLSPAELGRIEIRLESSSDGALRMTFQADRDGTLDLIRRDAADLAQRLGDAGLRTDSQSFSFTGGHRQRSQDEGDTQRSAHGWFEAVRPDAEMDTTLHPPTRSAVRSGGAYRQVDLTA